MAAPIGISPTSAWSETSEVRERKREKIFFLYLQELISHAKHKEHLCPPEDTWETLARQPEELSSVLHPNEHFALRQHHVPWNGYFQFKSWPK